MSNYDNTNRGSIWKNEKKEKDSHPDFTGSLNVEGREFWVSAWKRKPDAKEKAPALSFTIKPKEEAQEKPQAKQEKPQAKGRFDDFDSDVPFANPYKFTWRSI